MWKNIIEYNNKGSGTRRPKPRRRRPTRSCSRSSGTPTIGAVLGSNLARLFRLDAKSGTTLLGCGAAAGLASVFNAPLAGIFFVLEVLLRDFSLHMKKVIVCTADSAGKR